MNHLLCIHGLLMAAGKLDRVNWKLTCQQNILIIPQENQLVPCALWSVLKKVPLQKLAPGFTHIVFVIFLYILTFSLVNAQLYSTTLSIWLIISLIYLPLMTTDISGW